MSELTQIGEYVLLNFKEETRMKMKAVLQAVLLLLSMVMSLMLPTMAVAKVNNKDEESQLKRLVEVLEAKRIEMNIPGMALAVVKDDRMILAHGFGVMDKANNKPVTPETMFSIGSSSKAFTATLVAMLADEEKLSWDDLITKYLPEYKYIVDGEVLPMTFRDMLSHRTGYARNDFLWANGQASRDLILKTAVNAEPVAAFRKKFYYNNVMFLAAGEATAKIENQTWDAQLVSRIFKPLGMSQSTSKHHEAMASEHLSVGYQWNEETQSHDVMPTRNLNNVAPAGGIYSNINDMAQWVRFQLNKGKVGKSQLLSEEQLVETHEKQIEMNQITGYGLGWMLRYWQGKKVVEHGGSIDGFGAQVAFIPEESLGFVLLTNVTATPLQQGSIGIVFEHLLGDQLGTTDSKKSAKVDYQKYVGEYHANFGPFKDALFTFSVNGDGKPAVNVPGQMLYELKDPDDTGKWYFALTNTISVSFDQAKDGSVTAMRMHQNGINFELPRQGVPIVPEIEADALTPFLGGYDSAKLKGIIKAKIQNHRLAMDVPNQMVYELNLPDENGFRTFRIKSDTSVKFIENETGAVTAVELWQNKSELVETAMKLESEDVEEVLPGIDEILKLRKSKQRSKALKRQSGIEMLGQVHVKSSGIKGKLTSLFDDKGHFKQVLDFGVFGQTIVVINKNTGSTYGINPYTELKGKYLAQAKKENPAVLMDLSAYPGDIQVMAMTELNDRKVYQLKLKESDLPASTLYIDAETGDVVQVKTKVLIPSVGSVGVTTNYEDYRELHGLRMAYKVTTQNPVMGEVVVNLEDVKVKKKFTQGTFDTSEKVN